MVKFVAIVKLFVPMVFILEFTAVEYVHIMEQRPIEFIELMLVRSFVELLGLPLFTNADELEWVVLKLA